MENATKALLIAAAVLVAILVITFGVGIFGKASEQMGKADLSEYQLQQHNDKFTKYEGTNVSGSEVNAMLKTVFNHNLVQEDATTRVSVIEGETTHIDRNAEPVDGTTGAPRVGVGARYTVEAAYTNGLVTSLSIESLANEE